MVSDACLGGAKKVADLFAGVGALTLGQKFRASLYESDKAAVGATAKLGAVRRDLFRNPLLALDPNVLITLLINLP